MSNKTNEKTNYEDDIFAAFLAVERAKYLIDEMSENYFECNDATNEREAQKILYGFDKYRVFSELICHLLCDANEHLKALGASRF